MRVKGEDLVWQCPLSGSMTDLPILRLPVIDPDAGVFHQAEEVPTKIEILTLDVPAPRNLAEWLRRPVSVFLTGEVE